MGPGKTAAPFNVPSALPSNFVGFSYSRAADRAPSDRFINFLNEVKAVNILASLGCHTSRFLMFCFIITEFERERRVLARLRLLPRLQAGNLLLHFLIPLRRGRSGHVSSNNNSNNNNNNSFHCISVSLRVNGATAASALSEGGGANPVSQSAALPLRRGDAVQLEVVQGAVREARLHEFAYTSFTGWLIAPLGHDEDDGKRGGGYNRYVCTVHYLSYDVLIMTELRRHDDSRCVCDCCPPPGGSHPPHPPSYRPPLPPPPVANAPRHPPYILTTATPEHRPYITPPSYSRPPTPPAPRPGRDGQVCCDALLVSSGTTETSPTVLL